MVIALLDASHRELCTSLRCSNTFSFDNTCFIQHREVHCSLSSLWRSKQ